jgi:heptosyltransferase-3
MRRLLVRPGGIGDCILTFPAMEHLKADYTEVWISRPVVPLLRFADIVRPLSATGIDAAGIGDEEDDFRLQKRLSEFDLVVSWYGTNRPEFRQVVRASGVPSTFHAALPPAGCNEHACDFFSRQVGALRGLAPKINVSGSSCRRTAVIHPFSGSTKKNWPLDRYRQLAKQLPLDVNWVAGPEESLDSAVRFEHLNELAAWLAGTQLYIGNDSGITHLAAAVGVPVLALFGPTSPALWGPRGKQVETLHRNPISELAVETVAEAANRLLGLR